MKILSECLHKDVPKDVIDIIKNTKYSVHQMQVSLEFYEKGVPVQTIKEVMDKGENLLPCDDYMRKFWNS